MGLLDKIKEDTRKSGGNKRKLVYFRQGEKKRVRFLQDMDDGYEFTIHSHWDKSITAVCSEHYGKHCKFCDAAEEEEGWTTRTNYCWSVWDYDDNEVKIFMFAVTRCTPIPQIVAMYENYGTLTDRDYIITVNGRNTDKSYTVIPSDKAKFRNSKAKPYSKAAVLKILKQAYPDTVAGDDLVDEEHDAYEDTAAQTEYDDMTPKALYKLCKERDIDAKPKKNKAYYIELLKEYDEAQDNWGDDDDGDDWEDDDDDWE